MFYKRLTSLAAASVVGLLFAGTRPAEAAVLTFDNLTTEDPTDDPVPRRMAGFDFGPEAFSLLSDSEYTGPAGPSGFGNSYGSPSGAYAAFNTKGVTFLLIRRDTRFNFTGADFASFAERNAFQDFSARSITLRGFRDEQLVGQVTAPLSPARYDFVSAAFADVDQVAFVSSGLNPQAGTDVFYVFDNFTFAEVPEPGTACAVLAFGSTVLLGRRRGGARFVSRAPAG